MPQALNIEKLSFTYPLSSSTSAKVDKAFSLQDISFSIDEGSFTLLCGMSGSGKSTLLRLIKPELAPCGNFSGKIEIFGAQNTQLTAVQSAKKIGFVMQNPQTQIVMDTVWHELAFPLENLGLSTEEIRRKVAETAHFFGISNWFNKKTSELSGGQQQVLNLASALAVQPSLLLLDEPIAQLDPIAANKFIQLLSKINKELGITIIVASHSLQDLIEIADNILYLEAGALTCIKNTQDFACWCFEEQLPICESLPHVTQIVASLQDFCNNSKDFSLPLSVKEGRVFLQNMLNNCAAEETPNAEKDQSFSKKIKREKESLVSVKNIWYRYNKNDDFVLQGASFDLMEGEVHAILGSNGCGKSTLLKMLAKAYKPVRGKVISKKDIQICMMPQDPRTLFVCDTSMEDLQELMHKFNYTQNDIETILHVLDMAKLANIHCFDLSGGQLQKAALAKLLLLKPDVLLLDEPAKGLDAKAKQEFVSILKKLAANGCAIAIATHDLDFAASVADRCSMLFGGEITCTENIKDFFCGNMFFTTQTNCMTRNIIDGCILPQDVIAKFKVS